MRLPERPRQVLSHRAWRAAIGLLVGTIVVLAFPNTAAADATDDYPIPHRMIVTTCTAEQILAAARDFAPVVYERYIIDKNNRPPDVQQGAIDRIHWFFSLTPADRRAYSEEIATNIYGEPMAQRWGNWAKVFFNNKGVVAKETDNCANYPPDDQSVWDLWLADNTSIEENKATILRWTAAIERNDHEGVAAEMHPDARWKIHGDTPVGGERDMEGVYEEVMPALFSHFVEPLKFKLVGITAEGDRVAAEFTGQALLDNGLTLNNVYHLLF